jgi:hypothetical protein
MSRRYEAAQKEEEERLAIMRALFASPADKARRTFREFVRLDGDRLAKKAAVHLTMHAEYLARERFRKMLEKPPANVYPSWCKPTRQAPVVLQIPSETDLRAYVRQFDRLNGLKEVA